ncbi:MAG: hypothetical protein K0S81_680 [Rhodospirillales bacterium]|jgi:hypothetical protein|nr:hypothetical protein [Rhodospirillales bacterium]
MQWVHVHVEVSALESAVGFYSELGAEPIVLKSDQPTCAFQFGIIERGGSPAAITSASRSTARRAVGAAYFRLRKPIVPSSRRRVAAAARDQEPEKQ